MSIDRCICNGPGLFSCSKCKGVYYCSTACAKRDSSAHRVVCFAMDTTPLHDFNNVNLLEGMACKTFQIHAFYQHIIFRQKNGANLYKARMMLYRGIAAALILDPAGMLFGTPPTEHPIYTWEQSNKDILFAGIMFNAIGGIKLMRVEHAAAFIPPCLKFHISARWDAIGSWYNNE